MNKQFEFADFVDEFKVEFTAFVDSEGYWDDAGDWIEVGESTKQMVGIILPLSENDLKYAENGIYSVKDKKIYTIEPLSLGQKIEYQENKYTVQNFKDYSAYADVYIYFARYRENDSIY